MAKSFEGWSSLFEDLRWWEDGYTNPHLLALDDEKLDTGKDLQRKPFQVGQSRVAGTGALVSGAVKPAVGLSYAFRSDDCLKVFMSHLQMGTTVEVGGTANPFVYKFFPVSGTPDFVNEIEPGNGAYGDPPGRVYSVSYLKKYLDTTANSGTNAVFFKHAVCDKLSLEMRANEEALLRANFRFRDLDPGTAVPYAPGTTVGNYSSNRPFMAWSATALIGGEELPIVSLGWQSNQSLEEVNRVGRMGVEAFKFGEYVLEGAFELDLPSDALKHIKRQFELTEFAVVGTLYNADNDQVAFTLPHCKYEPFNFNVQGGNAEIKGVLPFRAFERAGTSPITVQVHTLIEFPSLNLIWDAWFGARTLAEFGIVDAAYGARDLGEYSIADRDL